MRPAPYAADSATSRGRFHPEADASAGTRSPFQRDRDRVLHSMAFRRLAAKTQVIMPAEGDHHRTRLTHTLEVAQIARSLARTLGFDEDLTEALALAHDLGHPPFGHTGEDAIHACVAPWGGFDHNVQSLRIVAELEQRYLDFDGLNLTWETLEGLAKRNGPPAEPTPLLRAYEARFGLALARQPGGEAQVAAIADDIAYNAHDLEDGLRAGLFDLDEARAVPCVARVLDRLIQGRAAFDPARLPFALAHDLINLFVGDVLGETRRRLAAAAPADVEAIRSHEAPMVGLSAPMLAASRDIKRFLFARMYRHPRLLDMRAAAARLLTELTGALLADPGLMPAAWTARARAGGDALAVARTVTDYVAGMTDRYAIQEHARLCGAVAGL